MRGNTITMHLARGRVSQTGSLFQYDYGQKLIFAGVELPQAYEVHFSNQPQGSCKTMIGDATGVEIPDEYLLSGENIHVFVYLHDGADDGETEYHGVVSVQKRGKATDQPPTPVQQSEIDQAIAALNVAVEQTAQDVIDTNAAKVAAETAQEKAETAQTAAETAQEKAETAQEAAETAQGKAEDAQEAAERAQGLAEDARDAAQGYASDANTDANRAEQAANNLGYLEMEIVDGHLIYRKTELIQTDFELVNGHLILEVA